MAQEEDIRAALLPVVLKYGTGAVTDILNDIESWASSIMQENLPPFPMAQEPPQESRRQAKKKRSTASRDEAMNLAATLQTLLLAAKGGRASIPMLRRGKMRRVTYSRIRHALEALVKQEQVAAELVDGVKYYKAVTNNE